jgi:hypothetical protein
MCFSLLWVENLLIWLVVVCAVVAVLRVLVAYVLPMLGLASGLLTMIAQIINIVIWAIVLVALIIFVFDLISCLAPMRGLR